jgi:hypothetical protein
MAVALFTVIPQIGSIAVAISDDIGALSSWPLLFGSHKETASQQSTLGIVASNVVRASNVQILYFIDFKTYLPQVSLQAPDSKAVQKHFGQTAINIDTIPPLPTSIIPTSHVACSQPADTPRVAQ